MAATSDERTVALYCYPGGKDVEDEVQMVAWLAEEVDEKLRLEYEHYYDHRNSWARTIEFLDCIPDRSAIYVTLAKKSKSEDDLLGSITKALTEKYDTPENTIVQPVAPTSAVDPKQLKLHMREIACREAWLQFNAMQQSESLQFVLNVLHETPPSAPNRLQSLSPSHRIRVLKINPTAADAIHLWPPENLAQSFVTGGSKANNSIYGVLSQHVSTRAGRRLLQTWLRQPLVDLIQIQARQESVQTLLAASVERDALIQTGLKSFGTLHLAKLAQALEQPQSIRKSLQALYNLYRVASQLIPLLVECLEQVPNKSPLLQTTFESLQESAKHLENASALVQAVVDLDQAPREFMVQVGYKPELEDIRRELDSVDAELESCNRDMQELWQDISNSTATVRLERSSDDTWQFRLPDTNAAKLLQQQKGITVNKLLKNGVSFTTKELRQLTTKQQDLRTEYDRYQGEVVEDAMKVAATYCPVLVRTQPVVSELDCLVGLAHTAAHKGYCRPEMADSDSPHLELAQARHPCVELQEGVDFIPNDCKLGDASFLIVTGPNMGGKSTYIRKLGAIVAMAQIGSYVPCDSAKINICQYVFDYSRKFYSLVATSHILARVGAGDMQERGISTFMAEMLESSSILRSATNRSLIIIDELGRGTSTFDGYGLARAISEYIVQSIGCLTVFATHFHELTALADQEAAVRNSHVTAQKGSHGLTFLYEVRPGPCLESFGIQVAEMANVPSSVVEDAKRRAAELERFENKKARVATPEEQARTEAFLQRFRSLSKDTLTQELAKGPGSILVLLQTA